MVMSINPDGKFMDLGSACRLANELSDEAPL
jgi:hypothetical protein